MSNVSITNDGIIVDKTKHLLTDTILVPVNFFNRITEINDIVAESVTNYERGIYISDSIIPIIKYGDNLVNKDNFVIPINSISDLINFVKENKGVKLSNLILTYGNIDSISRYFKERPSNDIFMKELCKYTESIIMNLEHAECDVVKKDMLNISNHISLEFDHALIHPTFSSYIFSIFDNIPYGLSSKMDMVANELLKLILDKIDFPICRNSIALELKNNMLQIDLFASPSNRRYIINVELMEESDV